MSTSGDRWTLYGSSADGKWSVADNCPAPPVPPMMIQFVAVEVMPVSEHEAALAAARQVNEAADVLLEALERVEITAEVGDMDDLDRARHDLAALAALTPEPEETL